MGEIYGALAMFDTPEQIVEAARRVRERGYVRFDCHTPFPVHGLEAAMGLTRSKLPFLVLGGGAMGVLAAILLQWWTGAVDYPLLIGGKPYFAMEFATPVTFELMVLFSAFTSVFGMLALNGLPMLYHPLFNAEIFARVTDDKFFISIEAIDPRFDRGHTVEFLRSLGASEVVLVEE
ncbi:MAG: DUF3341 domain-containing protein [Acidobacteriota bacterium]|nr:DUF3341 domain-containing protein [Blastocatellia bacterium]MDW8413011.1 DUF3341 domain-containing protein [Acidobacteriota bacterium]